MYPLIQWDGTDRWDSSMEYGTVGQPVGIPCAPIGRVGWDRQMGYIAVWTVRQSVCLWESHVYPLVQWDGRDRWDSSMDCETVGQSVGSPCIPIGTVGWDGQVG